MQAAAELHSNSSKTFQFLTKGQTLSQLKNVLQSASVLPLKLLTKAQYFSLDEHALTSIFSELNCESLVVRSSFSSEDSHNSSMAGMFKSVLNVTSVELLKQAIEDVFASYPNDHSHNEEVLIQAMVNDVKHCGVLFTRDQSSNAQYYIISDDQSGKTDVITSGAQGKTTSYVVSHEGEHTLPFTKPLVTLANELMQLFANSSIDLEYAIDVNNNLYILQARPLLCSTDDAVIDVATQSANLALIKNKLTSAMQQHPFLYGDTTVFGVMPDWNPAEIIGLYPKPLALSLYKSLITDSTWAYQRNNYGYRNLRSFPLMMDFLGLPYIDVRVSFNSFLPKDIRPSLGNKLVNYYINKLKENPKIHDSVEFDVVLSCYTPTLSDELKNLHDYGFSREETRELSAHLLQLTNRIIDPRTGLWIQDLHRIEKLKSRQQETKRKVADPISKIYWLLEDCKRYGTLPFAGLARAGFIAVQMLKSLVTSNILTELEYHEFLGSLNTVSGQMQNDFEQLSKSAFLREYGHLRPGTYDICSPRYDADPERYFNWQNKTMPNSSTNEEPKLGQRKRLRAEAYSRIEDMLATHGINHSADSFMHFIKSAIEGREYAKFVFTRSLSDAMEELAALGESIGITREDMAFANINVINDLISSSNDAKISLQESIKRGKQSFEQAQQIMLPTVITRPNDVYGFEVSESQPSYITRKTVIAEHTGYSEDSSYENKIVFITNADPGFDWLFSHNIAGLVTAYGGANSHMAIRAAELEIPAVIGAGDTLFKQWQRGNVLELDCQSHRARIIQ